jgi:hypothetical protein
MRKLKVFHIEDRLGSDISQRRWAAAAPKWQRLFQVRSVVPIQLAILMTLGSSPLPFSVVYPQFDSTPSLAGEWKGSYSCNRGSTGVTLKFSESIIRNDYYAVFSFYPLDASQKGPSGSFHGVLSLGNNGKDTVFQYGQAIRLPPGYFPVGFTGVLSADGQKINGKISSPGCNNIEISRLSGSEAASPGQENGSRPVDLTTDPSPRSRSRTAATLKPKALPQTYSGIWDGGIYHHTYSNRLQTRVTIHLSPTRAELELEDGRTLPMILNIEKEGIGGQTHISTRLAAVSGQPIDGFRGTFYTTPEQSIRRDAFGREVLELSVPQSPGHSSIAYLYRRDQSTSPIRSGSFQAWCKKGGEAWLLTRIEMEKQARQLKTELFDALKGYDVSRAGLLSIFADETFRRHFGVSINDLDNAGFERVIHGVRECMLSNMNLPYLLRENVGAGVIDISSLQAEWQSRRPPFSWRPAAVGSLKPLITRQTVLDMNSVMQNAEKQVASIVSGTERATTVEAIDEAITNKKDALLNVRPTVLASVLSSAMAQREKLQQVRIDERIAERRRKASERMAGIPIPIDRISPNRQDIIRSLVSGDPLTPSLLQWSFIAGMVDIAMNQCGLPTDKNERLSLAKVIADAGIRLNFGTQQGEFSTTAGSMFRHLPPYAEGSQTMQVIGCDDRFVPIFLSSVLELQDEIKLSADGGASLFVRSCSQRLSRQQCECVAGAGQKVMSSINNQTYSRALMADLMNSNIVVWSQIKLSCGIPEL